MSGLNALAQNWTSDDNFPSQFGGASDYAKKMSKRPLSYFRDRINNIDLSGKRVLDAGCGSGNWSFALASSFDEVYGIDYVKERTDLCSFIAEKYGVASTKFREGNILETGFADEYFDAVFCFGVIIVPQTPVEAALKEFKRITKPGGEIFVCLNAPGWAYYLASAETEARSELGKKGVYVHHRKKLDAAAAALASDQSAMAEIKTAAGGAPEALLEKIAASFSHLAPVADIVAQIRRDCGEAFTARLAEDFSSIAAGRQQGFPAMNGYPATYEPDEVKAYADDLGLAGFEWAEEGRLIRVKDPSEVKPIYAGSFEDKLANWEFIVRRGA